MEPEAYQRFSRKEVQEMVLEKAQQVEELRRHKAHLMKVAAPFAHMSLIWLRCVRSCACRTLGCRASTV